MHDEAIARRGPRRALFMGILVSVLLMLGGFAGGMAFAAVGGGGGTGGGGSGGGGGHCRYNSAHQLVSGPSYCQQSNWSCVGTDVGGCVDGLQEVKYSGSCPQSVKYIGCTAATAPKAAPSRFVRCTSTYHIGLWQPWVYTATGGQTPSGNLKRAYAAQCTNNPPLGTPQNPGCTPNGTLTQHFLGCVGNGIGTFNWTNSCGSVENTSTGPATRCDTASGGGSTPSPNPPSGGGSGGGSGPTCTIRTTYGTPQWTGCSAQGVETGYQPWTAVNSCGGTSSGSNPVAQHTTASCQPTIRHQCAYAQPGYAQQETCLTSPQGGYADCSGWSTPYYDPYDCPIPTPIGN